MTWPPALPAPSTDSLPETGAMPPGVIVIGATL